MRTAAEAADELEAFGAFYGALAARAYWGDHVCLAAQPANANGSYDELVERGAEDAAAITGRWADEIAAAVDDRSSAGSVLTALGGLELDLAPFARIIEREILHGALLGAVDSEWERAHDEEIAPVKFVAAPAPAEGAFSSLPFADAVRLFQEKQVLPRPAFDALEQGAKRTAFTVARMASAEMLNVTKAELARVLHAGRHDGQGPNLRDFRQFAKDRLESAGWTPANRSHVETIYRTNVGTAYASGRFVEMRQPAVLALLPLWQIRGVNDSRARPTHKAAFGIVLPADHPFWKTAYPPFGYNCLLPGTAVRGNFTGGSRARYSGKAIELTTAKGRRLSVTANHPVLTRRGFVPARELCEGDELVSYRDEPGVLPLGERPERHEHNAPATVEEVFGALSQAGGPLFTGYAPQDFHGEAKRFRGEIEVVGSYANLPREMEAAPFGQLTELALEAADAAHLSAGARGETLRRIFLPAASDPRLAKLAFHSASVALQRLPFRALRVAAPTELDAVLTENASEGRSRDAELVGELLRSGAAHVALDQVRHVREFDFCGHVYDLETTTGWFMGSGIAIGNCRCKVIARTRRWLEREGKELGPVPKNLPDPGFDSGTNRLISVPASALEQPKAPPAPVAPKAPAPAQPPPTPEPPPGIHAPLPPLPPAAAPPVPWLDDAERAARAAEGFRQSAPKLARLLDEGVLEPAFGGPARRFSSTVRAETQDFIRALVPDAVTRDGPAGTLFSRQGMVRRRGAWGSQQPTLKRIDLDEKVRKNAQRAFKRLAKGEFDKPKALSKTAVEDLWGLHVYVHEEAHGFSRSTITAYRGAGAVLEEVGTELTSWEALFRAAPGLGAPEARSALMARRAYPREIDQVLDVVMKHTGDNRDAAIRRVVHAHGKIIGPGAPIATPSEHVREFVAGLDLSPERAQLVTADLEKLGR